MVDPNSIFNSGLSGLGFSATELPKKLGVSQPVVSISVKRGEKITKFEPLSLSPK
jgi:hypothetical protein